MPDPWSNQVVSQVIVGAPPNEQIELTSSAGAGRMFFLSNQALEKAPAELIGEAEGSGGGLFLAVGLFSPEATSTDDRVIIFLRSSTADSTGGAVCQLIYQNAAGAQNTVASFGAIGWQFAGGSTLPLAVPTGYPLGGSPTTTQLATTVNSLISILIAANIIT